MVADGRVDSSQSEETNEAGETPIPKVRFEFLCEDSDGAEWRVRRLEMSEGLSEPYELSLDLVSPDLDANPESLIGGSCELLFEREAMVRNLRGVVRQVDSIGFSQDRLSIRVQVVPALWMLSQRLNSRIWQDVTVPELLEELLGEELGYYSRSARWELQRDYEVRDYVVQYNESDLAFVNRLLEEEGISYYFDHESESTEVIVFVDRNESFPPVQTMVPGVSEIPIIVDRPDQAELESAQSFDWCQSLGSTSLFRRDYDWQQPNAPLDYSLSGSDLRGFERERYEYGARRFVVDDGERRAEDRHQAFTLADKYAKAHSNVMSLAAGCTFELVGNVRPELEQGYLVTRVRHFADCPEELLVSDEQKGRRYDNLFECVPLERPFRPNRLQNRPLVRGPHTAIVTGPSGEEIYTDEHGRVKVQFHWDRLGQRDENSSCWIRVAQGWAGPGYGGLILPRIGMEVVVEFLEGNPDRPLITGCVYNGRNPPPVALPNDKTQSTFRTSSSPGGDGYNELRFEDKSGSEEVFLHAEKNLKEVVKNNHSTSVSGNQTNTVNGDQTEAVKKKQSLTVDDNRTKLIKKNETITVNMNRTATISGNNTLNVAGATALGFAGGVNMVVTGSMGMTVSASPPPGVKGAKGGGGEVKQSTIVEGESETEVAKSYRLNANEDLELFQAGGQAKFVLNKQGEAELLANNKATLNNGKSNLDFDAANLTGEAGKILLKGKQKVTVEAQAEILLKVGTSSVKLTPSGVTIDAGPGMVTIKGSTIMEN